MEEDSAPPDSNIPQSDFDAVKLEVLAANHLDPPKPPRVTQSARGPQRPSSNLTPPTTPLPSAQDNDLMSSRRVPLNGPLQPQAQAEPSNVQQERPNGPSTQQNAPVPNSTATNAPADQRERLGRST
jgi:hypothetical protein